MEHAAGRGTPVPCLRGGKSDDTFRGQTITKGGDVIIAFDGRRVRSADDVVRLVSEKLPGEVARITIIRGGKQRVVTVRLGARPQVN